MRKVLFLITLAPTLLATTYTTNFPLTENPISEGGVWSNGGQSPANVFTNIQTTAGLAFGTMAPSNGNDNDSTALLTGLTWGPNQTASATVKGTGNYANGMEVELRLRSAFAANSCTGYELDIAAGYIAIVRWNGPLNNFTVLASNTSANWSLPGSTVKGTISGSTITVYVNGVVIAQANDSTYANGSPGIGMFISQGGDSTKSDMGFTSYTVTDGLSNSTPPPAAPPSVPTALSATPISSSQINLSWAPSSPSSGGLAVAGYQIFRLGTQIATSSTNSFSDTNLAPSTQYSYTVAAYDTSGNASSQSAPVLATTLAQTVPVSPPPSLSAVVQ